ncbi:MAG: protein translocase subunit SecD, partial [Alphaproteobacteria bacterium]|nr:protein translocase subunit SecD [Alphaproteobacteria bacterium]
LRARLPSWLPHQAVNYGLDLQGGSYLMLEVDLPAVQKEKAEGLLSDMTAALRKAGISFRDTEAKGDTVRLTVTDSGRYAEAKSLVQNLNPVMSASFTGSNRQYALTEPGGGTLVLKQTPAYAEQTRQQILEQSVNVVRRRIDELGTREPSITVQQPDRIAVEVPGLSDPARLKEILGKTAKMTFQLVDMNADQNAKTPPIGDEILPMMNQTAPKGAPQQTYILHRRIMVSGERLVDASAGFDSRTGSPAIQLRFDSIGARQFGDTTKANVGKPFATVLDKQIIQVANINEPILGGSAQITGSFSAEYANNIALLMRSGALPAPLNIIEERTVGAELGADSIKAGKVSAVAGLALVALFMVLRYGLFGIFADLALTLNLILLLAALTPLATLTLPGIAGIVLTLGMAVDANVLIFERIREEQRNGRGMLGAIDAGFKRAMATIFDANATHLIAALTLFELAQGPVKGFAVALFLGIITSFFTSVVVTRLIVITWLNIARPRTLTV